MMAPRAVEPVARPMMPPMTAPPAPPATAPLPVRFMLEQPVVLIPKTSMSAAASV